MPDAPLLRLSGLQAWYGESHVLHGVDLDVVAGEVVTLLGRNGAGKSSTLKSIMGLMPRRAGSIRLRGTETITWLPEQVGRAGIALCPEDRGIYAGLTVTENLLLPPVLAPGGMALDHLYHLFPNLLERGASQGTMLSGGEQQMLAIARILRTGARLLLLDEPTEGLAPAIVDRIGEVILQVKAMGFTVLLVEQNFRFAARLADRHYVMEHGRILDQLTRAEVGGNLDKLHKYLGV